MLRADEIEELRALQARAYGRGGGLTDADADRLRQLEDTRSPVVQSEPGFGPTSDAEREPLIDAVPLQATSLHGPGAGARVTAEPHRPTNPHQDTEPPRDGVAPASDEQPRPDALPRALRGRWPVAAVSVAVLVGLGVLIGWLVFADRGAGAISLTPEQQQWQSELLATGLYDSGSLRAIREEEGVVIWSATQKGGENVCLILADGQSSAPACTTEEQVRSQGLYASITTVGEGELQNVVDAQMYLDDEGDAAVIAYSYITSSNSGMQFASPSEAEAAAQLEGFGYDRRSIMVVGYDGDVPVWFATEKNTQRACLIYDGSQPDPLHACVEGIWTASEGLPLMLDRVDEDGSTTRYEYELGMGRQYLTISKGVGDGPG